MPDNDAAWGEYFQGDAGIGNDIFHPVGAVHENQVIRWFVTQHAGGVRKRSMPQLDVRLVQQRPAIGRVQHLDVVAGNKRLRTVQMKCRGGARPIGADLENPFDPTALGQIQEKQHVQQRRVLARQQRIRHGKTNVSRFRRERFRLDLRQPEPAAINPDVEGEATALYLSRLR